MIGDDRPRKHLLTFLNESKGKQIDFSLKKQTETFWRKRFSRQVAFVTMQLLNIKLHNFQKLPEKN